MSSDAIGLVGAAVDAAANYSFYGPITRFYYNRAHKQQGRDNRPVPLADLIGFAGHGPREARFYHNRPPAHRLLKWDDALMQLRCCDGTGHENIQEQLEADFLRRPT